jgi:hypothetical protein
MILGPSVLYGVAAIALVLTIVRRPAKHSDDAVDAIVRNRTSLVRQPPAAFRTN